MTTRIERVKHVTSELERLGRVAMGIQQRYAAHFQLHTAACLNRDEQEMRQRREELHTVLDALLDNGESVQKLSDELVELSRI
jgi:hypothetical protein